MYHTLKHINFDLTIRAASKNDDANDIMHRLVVFDKKRHGGPIPFDSLLE